MLCERQNVAVQKLSVILHCQFNVVYQFVCVDVVLIVCVCSVFLALYCIVLNVFARSSGVQRWITCSVWRVCLYLSAVG